MIPQGNDKFWFIDVVPSGEYFHLSSSSNEGIAHPDFPTCRALRSLIELPAVKLKAVVEPAQFIGNRKKSVTKFITPLSVNIYGPYGDADQAGRCLASVSAFLQHPFFLESDVKYFNPQIFRLGNQMADLTHLAGLSERDLRLKAVSEDIKSVLESLDCPVSAGEPGAISSSQPGAVTIRLTRYGCPETPPK